MVVQLIIRVARGGPDRPRHGWTLDVLRLVGREAWNLVLSALMLPEAILLDLLHLIGGKPWQNPT